MEEEEEEEDTEKAFPYKCMVRKVTTALLTTQTIIVLIRLVYILF